jgi:hypothetical protein
MNISDAGKTSLRHGLTYLWPSEIADQFYCEYKVHLKRLHPEVRMELPCLEMGEVSHMALVSQAEPVTPVEIVRSIRAGKKLAICEWMLEGCFHGVRIRGRPDYFAFEGKKALLLLDFKLSRAKKAFRDHRVQAEIYALLAESMAFSTDQLYLGIVLFPSVGPGSSLTKTAMLKALTEDGTLHKISEQCARARESLAADDSQGGTVESECWKAFLFRYDPKKAVRNLTWALGYWLAEREPIPVKRLPRKCFACPWNAIGLCPHAQHPPDPKFRVRQSLDGRTFVFHQR